MVKTMDDKPNLIIAIDADLKNSFKAACAMNGVKMTDVLLKCIESYVNTKQRRRA